MSVPYTFASATTSLPLSQLDANFSYFADAITVSSGNVGINSSSPNFKLDVIGTGRISNLFVDNSYGLSLSTNPVNGFLAYGWGGGGYTNTAQHRWYNGITTEIMRLNDLGYLLIGYAASNGAYKLQVNSQIFATSSTIATSDGNYKENINTLENPLDLVCALNPVSFDWKEHPVHNFDRSTTTIGFIAQEVQTALQNTAYVNAIVKTNICVIEPEEKDADGNITKPAVTEEFLGIAEGNLIALLTASIKELKAELDAIKSELNALKNA